MDDRITEFQDLCGSDNLQELIEYVDRYNITKENACSTDSWAIRWAYLSGNLEVVQFLINRFKITRADIDYIDEEVLDSINWESGGDDLGPKSAAKLS